MFNSKPTRLLKTKKVGQPDLLYCTFPHDISAIQPVEPVKARETRYHCTVTLLLNSNKCNQ